ncbi:Clp protease N-terminal domain-containing protein [Amycolatopsis sp.]|uniref:Clp protease N-terminal domain-containing protein n=1 Tax=Amycolatopsis sp. TaxID=37632 RepID=UPI002BC6CD33|nr:Clp protease N-terminal domain-containing protein [Amycolatopsis sp.]HVV11158.1 Clp protease N-terminal domain-containing protein [Amycolatopsis sp.]
MFERFTDDARAVVTKAHHSAIEQHAAAVDTLHVLAALVGAPESRAVQLLGRLNVPAADVTDEIERVRRRGGITDADAQALGELGIDVDRIIERVEEAHGPGAFAQRFSAKGHLPFADDSKKTLELCLKEVIRAGGKHLGSEHILIALTLQRGPAADVLARFDVDTAKLREALT